MLKDILQTPRPITPLTPDTIFSVAGFPIANTTLMVLFIALLIFILGYFVFRKFTLAPHTKFQIAVEMLYEMVIGLISQLTGGKERAQAIFPIIGAMLVYLTFANLLASFPILGEITYSGKQFLRGATADFNTTLGLAFASVVAINIISIREWGFFGWIGKFFKFKEVYLGFKKGLAQGGIACIDFFVGMLDIIGEA
ncbi:MAG: F0F1-type ATP synthase membrane subunit a, partial [Flavobacteriaceae bacterium]